MRATVALCLSEALLYFKLSFNTSSSYSNAVAFFTMYGSLCPPCGNGSVTPRVRLILASGKLFCPCVLSTTSFGVCGGMVILVSRSQEESIANIVTIVRIFLMGLEFELITDTWND